MIMIGTFEAIAALTAIIDDEFFVVTPQYTLEFDTTTWGWIHLILGATVALSGVHPFFRAGSGGSGCDRPRHPRRHRELLLHPLLPVLVDHGDRSGVLGDLVAHAAGRAPRVGPVTDESPTPTTLLAGVGVLGVLAVVLVLQLVDDGDALSLFDGEGSTAWQYISIFLLIAADAVFPVFPGESTLNPASTLAAKGVLELPVVIVMGALGAIVGDSALYWIARLCGARIQSRLDAAKEKKKVADAVAPS
jgi:hypothetical protein